MDKLGRYLQGNYLTSSPGSVVDVLSQYYITYYTLLKEADPKVKAASDTEDMIGYLYYAYVMGNLGADRDAGSKERCHLPKKRRTLGEGGRGLKCTARGL